MSTSKLDNPALILIDIQKGFHDVAYWGGDRNNIDAEQKAGELLEIWRTKNLPIFSYSALFFKSEFDFKRNKSRK